MTEQQELAALMARRRLATDRAPIDAAIHARFGALLAVLFTDLVGFSRLVEAFGILHFLQLIHESESPFLPAISDNGGACLKREGDSLMAVFDAPASALAAGRAMLAATRKANPGRSAEERIDVCIGMGYGDVLRIDGDVGGAGVNAASNLGEDTACGVEMAPGPP